MNRESVLSRQILTYMMLLTFTINNQSDIRGFFNDQTFLADTHPAKRGRVQPEKNFAGPTGCPGLLCQFQAGRDQSPGHGFQ